jgi:hypothetical protein
MLNLCDFMSKICTIAVFIIVDLQMNVLMHNV